MNAARPFIKVCCIMSAAEARMAIDAGAAAIGLVSAMPSGPGVIEDGLIAEIAAGVPAPTRSFLLTCRRSADAIAEQHARCGTSTLQLVDQVPHDQLRRLRRLRPEAELVQVVHVQGQASLAEAIAVAPLVDALLLDSGRPAAAVKELGGTGRTHDWALSRRIRDAIAIPLILAGGLDENNVASAIAAVRPDGIDLCSSVRSDGRLDRQKLQRFVGAVRAH